MIKTIIYNLLLLLFFLCHCKAQDPIWKLCNNYSNISRNSQVSQNIDSLLVKLVSETPAKGFSATSYGQDKNKVFGLAQCRGDTVGRTDCSSCIQEAAKTIKEICLDQADSRIWYDFCFLRYSQEDFIGKLDTSVGLIYFNVANVTETDTESFNKELAALMDKIRSEAVVPGNQGLGKGQTELTPFFTLYALVQCNGDLSAVNCAQCLATAVGNFPKACNNKKGCQVLYSSCRVRYELYPFFFPLESFNTQTIRINSVTIFHP